jgi:hemophore-related protein
MAPQLLDEGARMLSSARPVRRRVIAAIGAGTLAGAMLVGGAATAAAEPPPAPLPNCTAADLAGVMAGVGAATSAYLFTHPDVNAFFTSLKGQPKEEIRAQARTYLDANPQVRAELQGIRQPSVDFRNRCQ